MDGRIDRCINGAMTRMTILFIKHSALVASEVQSGGGGVISAPALCLGNWASRGEQTQTLLHVFWLFYIVLPFPCTEGLSEQKLLPSPYQKRRLQLIRWKRWATECFSPILFCVFLFCFVVNTRKQESTLKQEKLLVLNKCFLFLIHLNHCSWTRE